jgi:amino acid permease
MENKDVESGLINETAPILGHKEPAEKTWWERLNPLPHGSMASSGFNLASATLGAGTLALPAAFQSSGVVLGALLLILCAAATVYSIRLLIKVAEKTGHMTYESMSKNLIGKRMDYVTEALIVLFCWGITVVYVVMIGNILDPLRDVKGFPEVFKGANGLRLLTTIFWAIFMLPLSLAKEINTLRYASMVGIMATFVLMSAVVAHCVLDNQPRDKPKETTNYAVFNLNMIMALPIITFSFCCQTNCFEIYTELSKRSVRRMTLSAAVSMTICTCIYIVVGSAGYIDFHNAVHGNILKNYSPVGTPYLEVAFVAISITLTMAFPICIFPTRDAFIQLFGYKDAYTVPPKVRLLISFVLASASLVVGLFTPGVKVLFDLLGGVCGSSLSFILPAIFALRAGDWTVARVGWTDVILTWALLIVGIIVGVLGTVVPIVQMIQG